MFTYTECKKWFHPSCHSTPNSIAKNYKMPRLSILNEIFFCCCIFIFFSPRTIPFTDQTQILKRPFHSRIKVTLSPRTIPFTDQRQTITHTIPFTDHSLHGLFTDRCHGPIIYRLTSHTANMPINLSRTVPYMDHSIRPLSRTYIKPID